MDTTTIPRDCHTSNAVQVNFQYLKYVFPDMFYFVVHAVDIYLKKICCIQGNDFRWKYFVTINDAFYMVPDSVQNFRVKTLFGFDQEYLANAEEAGVIATFHALDDLSKNMLFDKDNIRLKKQSLLDYTKTQSYFSAIQAFIGEIR